MVSVKNFFLLVVLILSNGLLISQGWDQKKIERNARQRFPTALEELKEFIAIPNDGHYPEQTEQNVAWIIPRLQVRGLKTEVVRINNVPFVLAEATYYPDAPYVLFYLQIDGQPVAAEDWDQTDPYQAVRKRKNDQGDWEIQQWTDQWQPDDRLFGRSTSDSKGPALSLLNAFDVLNAAGIQPAFNVRLVLDFQEEMSSPQLPELVKQHSHKLAADRLVVMDGTRHVSNLPTLTFGARGIATATIRVFGPRQPMHSGQYGNFVPNPVFSLSRLIGNMKDEEGRVLLPGWYDGISLSEAEKKVMNSVPENADSLAARIGIARPERVGGTYQEALAYPTLNVRGLKAAFVGGAARTIIPDQAIAMFDIRLVPESDGERLLGIFEEYLKTSGYHLIEGEPTEAERGKYPKLANFTARVSYGAYRTPFASPIGGWLSRALTRAFDAAPVRMRTTGGSQPISPFIQTLGLPAVSVRIPNPDNNIHAANENLRLGNYLEGIQTCVAILTEPLAID